MGNDQTGTIWDRLTGEGLVGPLASHRLEFIPVHVATVEAWLNLHPESLAPDPRESVRPRTLRPGEMVVDPSNRATVGPVDQRLPPRQLVLGVCVDGHTRAFVLASAPDAPIVSHSELGGVPMVRLAASGSWPLAYDRRVEGEALEFHLRGGEVLDGRGIKWSPEGRALTGDEAAQRLRFVPSVVTEWFAWAATYPGTDIARLDPSKG